MKLQKTIIIISMLATVLSLTACDNKAPTASKDTKTTDTTKSTASAPATIASSTTTTVTTTTTASTSTLSPTMEYWIVGNKAGIGQMLAQQHPKITPEQKSCLQSIDGNANYTKELQPLLDKTFTPEELAQSNDFFASADGKKFIAMTKSEVEGGGATPKMSVDEQKAMMAAMSKPFMQKMQQQTAAQDPKAMMAMMTRIADSEKARCKIG